MDSNQEIMVLKLQQSSSKRRTKLSETSGQKINRETYQKKKFSPESYFGLSVSSVVTNSFVFFTDEECFIFK